MDQSESASQFWAWAAQHYRRPGVANAALRLQDEFEYSVALVFWIIWTDSLGIIVTPQSYRRAMALVSDCEATLLTPMRDLRRHLKSLIRDEAVSFDTAVYDKAKSLELGVEKRLYARLEKLSIDNKNVDKQCDSESLVQKIAQMKPPLDQKKSLEIMGLIEQIVHTKT